MIRFKTIDPAEEAKTAEKEKAADKAGDKPFAGVAPPAVEPAETGGAAAEGKGKGMTRKAPLRARKPDAARLFRD